MKFIKNITHHRQSKFFASELKSKNDALKNQLQKLSKLNIHDSINVRVQHTACILSRPMQAHYGFTYVAYIHTYSLLTTCQNANCTKCEQNFVESIRISIQHSCFKKARII